MATDGFETDSGRARVMPIQGEQETLHVQQVFTAIGAEVENSWQHPDHGESVYT